MPNPSKIKKVFAVGDMHLPWTRKNILRQILSAIEREQPDVVIQMGDLYDMFSQTRFARTQRLITPQQEATEARRGGERFWKMVQKIAPNAQCIQIKGNHDDRAYKRLIEKAPELEPFFSINEFFTFPNVRTYHDSRHELIIDGVLYTHGHYSKLGAHMLYYLRCVVRAHDHTGGLIFNNVHGKTIWEMSVGYVGDKHAIPLQYSATKTVKWTWGYGIIDEHGPRFCPLL